jgi:voltage-gated sodium channel
MIKKFFLNDQFILILILVNAGVIFIEGFDEDGHHRLTVSLIDNLITLLFITELVVKLKTYGTYYFSSKWNKFDFILILLSVPALIAFLLPIQVHDYSFLLIFRVMRIFKSFRFLKFIPGIDHLIRGIQRALKASLIVLLGFAIYIFIVGVFSFYLFKDTSYEYFRNPLIALYSTFKICTIEGWFEIPEAVTNGLPASTSFIVYIYFIFVVLSGGIMGLSLVNSIFVDAMISDNNDALELKIDKLEIKIDALLSHHKSTSDPPNQA